MKILKNLEMLSHSSWFKRGFWLRALLCWVIGIAFLWNDYNSNYDYRFKIRGTIRSPEPIVLILFSEHEWKKLKNVEVDTFESLRALYINETLTDNFYWDENIWADILQKLLAYNPERIGLTFFFGQNLGSITVKEENDKIFKNNKIIWPSRINSEGQFQLPLFSKNRNTTGFINLYPDLDGIVRSFGTSISEIPHYAYTLAKPERKIGEYNKNYFINYQIQPDKFKTYRISDLLNKKIPVKELQNKIIIVGTLDSNDHMLPTPFGFMNKAEILGQVALNFKDNSFLKKFPISYYTIYLFFLLSITLVIVTQYPQNYSLALVVGFGAVIAGISAWIFDVYYLWTPILSGIIQMTTTYIIFVGYKLSQNERKTWHLEQEKKYLAELEQLKNNFISLISHDLKTPLAKIQGITGRLLQNNNSEENLKTDLETIKNSSQDLYRYIQSILQVIRVESSEFKIKREAADINQIVDKVVLQLRPLALEKNIQIETNLEPLFSTELDIGLIHEVIANLIENAIKYTPQGGKIFVSTTEKENQLYLEVKDTGDGIPKEELGQVWEKFYRGKKHNISTQGTGLGLYLVKYFVELHGGSVFLNSEVNIGTRIGFKLPV